MNWEAGGGAANELAADGPSLPTGSRAGEWLPYQAQLEERMNEFLGVVFSVLVSHPAGGHLVLAQAEVTGKAVSQFQPHRPLRKTLLEGASGVPARHARSS